MTLYWLTETLAGLPLALWIYLGIGIPWSLALLPRRDWHARTLVLALAFAVGPALLTAWMLILGVIGSAQEQPLMRFDLSFAGSIVIALIGTGLAWRKRITSERTESNTRPLAWDERLLLALIAAALVVRWLVTAYWPFTWYDSLWVYGWQGRLYTQLEYIPQQIDYYPQFLQLQYAFIQLAQGGFADHAARAVVPLLQVGSIFAAYVLGRRLASRRVGIILAALWALYPHVGDWARVGDLEIPLAFLFTLAAAFFLMAWTETERSLRRRYALLAGLMLGVALWAKPTAGAFVWGVMLLVAVEGLRVRFNIRAWWPRFEVAALTGIACIPLGGVWYVRNILLGHDAVTFPHFSWLALARQSGDLFGWALLALALLLILLALRRGLKVRWWLILPGVALVLAGLLPSMPWLNPNRFDAPLSRMLPLEWTLAAAGVVLILSGLWPTLRRSDTDTQGVIARVGWGWLLALPYFLTWFISYSYHARLSFAIVPLLGLPAAILIARLLPAARVQSWHSPMRALAAVIIIALALPGIVVAYINAAPEDDWLWTDRYPDDEARYIVHNPGVVLVTRELNAWIDHTGEQPRLLAPGEQRLRFFFPLLDVGEFSLPTRLDELQGYTHYIYGTQARWRYADADIDPLDNQIVSSLAREEVMTQMLRHAGTFRYELYELHPEGRYTIADSGRVPHALEMDVRFGDAVRYVADGVSARQLLGGKIFVDVLWEVLAPLDEDYIITYRLVNLDDGQEYAAWDGPAAAGEHAYYGTHLWEPGEYVLDTRVLELPPGVNPPQGQNYRLVVGFESHETGERLPVTASGERGRTDGELSSEGYMLFSPIYVGGE